MAEDFLAQVRSLNPDLAGYDDQTLAAAIGDQHPDYKPKLAKYFPDTAANVLSAQGAAPPPTTVDDQEPVEPKEAARLEFAKAHEDISPFAAAEKGAAYLGSEPVKEKIKGLPWGVRGAANVGAAAGQFALEQVTPENAVLAASLPILPAAGARAATGLFAGTALYDTIKRVPGLWELYKKGDWDNFEREATKAGLGGLIAAGLTTHAIKGRAAMELGDQAADLKAKQKVADVLGTPEAQADVAKQQEVVDALKAATAEAPAVDEMRPKDLPETVGAAPPIVPGAKGTATPAAVEGGAGGPVTPEELAAANAPPEVRDQVNAQAVETPNGEKVIPNDRAQPEMTAELKQQLADAGVDPTDHNAVAAFLTQLYGLKKPMVVESVGEVSTSVANETPDAYPIELGKGPPAELLSHEVQHARVEEGQIPGVPEGPGANDAIVGQVTDDIGGRKQVPRDINVDHLQTTEGVKAELKEQVQRLPPRQVIPRSETVDAATNLGFSIEDAEKLADGTTDLHERIIAASQIVTGATEKYHMARDAWLADRSNVGAKAAAEAAQRAILQTMEPFTRAATNIARGLSALNAERGGKFPGVPSDIATLLAEMQKEGPLSQSIRNKLLETDLGDPAQRASLRKFLGMKGPSLNRKIGFYYINALISALPTWGVKVASDVATLLTSPVRTAVGSTVKRGLFGLGFKSIKEQPHPLAETQARVAGMWTATHDALAAFTQALKTGSSIYNREPAIAGLPGKIIGTPMRILGAITDAAHTVAIRGELYEQGIRKALNKGLEGSEAWDAAREHANNPGEGDLAKAQKEARIDTLTQPPGRIMRAALQLREEIPGGVVEAPIVLTPQNLVKAAFDNSPAGFIRIARQLYTGEEVSTSQMGRAALGTMMWYWGYQMAKADRLSGAGPTDPKEFSNKLKTGWRPQSVQVAGQWLPLRALGPIGYSLATVADVAEIVKAAPRTDGVEDLAVMSADHMMRFALQQPMVQGLADTFELMKDPKYIPIAVGRTAGGFVPSIVARAGAAMDNNQRKIDGFGAAIRARIPIYREGLSPKRDWRGRPIPEPGTPAERFASPVARSEQMDLTPSDQAYLDANIAPMTNRVKVKGMDFKLNREDLDRYEQLAGAIVDRKFNALDKAPSHLAALSDDQRKDRISSIVKGAREKALYGQGGLVSEMKESGTYQAYVEAATGKKMAKEQANPYTHMLALPGADKAQETLDRYGIPDSGRPGRVPEELADEYNDELDRQRSTLFHRIYSDPADLGSKPYEQSRAQVQQIEDEAEKNAAAAVLRRAGVKR